ncbi:ABC transporter permease subunit [Spirillospora sp. NPDC048911]|uniref:ABC transporter permease subunit n=1 Tax=Spirillospora sp. NPDC048911 TaxID=3364527 RepID=UPI003711A100
MKDVFAAEWLKLRTARSTYFTLVVPVGFVVMGAALAFYSANMWDSLTVEDRAHFALSSLATLNADVTGLCLAILGVLAVTGEYRTGMIRTTLTVVPRRSLLLFAKAGVIGGVALLAGLAVTFVTFFTVKLIIGDRPIRGQPTGVVAELPELVSRGAAVTVYALLGLGLAVILRSTAGAIASVFALWYVVPIIIANVPAPWNERLGSFMLGGLPDQVIGGDNENSIYGSILPPPVALLVLLAYAAIPLAAAAFLLNRRDA